LGSRDPSCSAAIVTRAAACSSPNAER
jgi:hypothetical protein